MKVTTALLILIASSTVSCYCPVNQIHGIGHCSYRIQCTETVDGIKLDNECEGSSNYDVRIDLSLRNATDTFHLKADINFLSMITTLTVFGNWPITDLSFLESMYHLRNLYLSYNNIEKINGSPFRSLLNLETIDLSHNSISVIYELFIFDIRPYKMRKLSLAFNFIEEVPGDTFEALTSLNELDLSYNFIKELNEEPFCNLTNLEILKLNNNKIIYLNGAMNNLLNLKHLYLGFNQIEYIDMETLKTINHLETFDISRNKIEILKPDMFSRHWDHLINHTTCRIVFAENHISVIRNATTDLYDRFRRNASKNLIQIVTELDLSKNSITHIDYNAFQTIVQLVSLDLSNNKLISFLVNSEDLIYVKYLNLSSNYLNRLYYESFSMMHNLQNLDLSHNSMDYFPDQSLANTYNIKYLNVTYNDILEIHNLRITFHSEGGILDLSNNGLSKLNIPVGEASGLTELRLNSNNITDAYLIILTDQRDLTRLNMRNNFIQELDENSLQLPITIVYLDLSFNKIQRIGPSAFHRVSHLKTLRLAHNLLHIIEYGAFSTLTSLLNLDLSYNNVTYLDSKVFMDLKSLSVLSLQYNGLNYFEYGSWLTQKNDLKVYLDGNDLSCDWLAKALNDYSNGYSKMFPTVLVSNIAKHSIDGIQCVQENQNIIDHSSRYIMDERLLITSQKILEAVQEQTLFMKKYAWHSILHDAKLKSEQNNIFK